MNDSNVSRLRSDLNTYLDLVIIKDDVGCILTLEFFFHVLIVRYLFIYVT